ncbi:DNA polymerase [Pseudomonas chlororaphis]
MTNQRKSLLFIRDYTAQGDDKLYLWANNELSEVPAAELTKEGLEIICHDYWLIAPAIFKATGKLPKLVTDIEELRISISGNRIDRESKEKVDIANTLNTIIDSETTNKYLSIFNRTAAVDKDVLATIGDALIKLADQLEVAAKETDEWERFILIERPVTEQLNSEILKGISINTEQLRTHKKNIDFEYYMALKDFSARYNMPLEVPTEDDIINYLEPRGYDFSGVNVDYVLKFVPMPDNFATDLLKLLKIAKSRKVLNLIPLSQKNLYPIIDVFGSITSRIYFKDPSLQNLAKQHRTIISPSPEKIFSYVDFEQYEAGIMAALSDDPELLKLYSHGDLYEIASEEIFNNKAKRKEAKRLFLSYAYGMKKQSLYDAASGYGAERQAAKKFFNSFTAFEQWKISVQVEFEKFGYIKTCLGNHMKREKTGPLTEQEKRSAVSQLVQGTASLIFKKTLLKLKTVPDIEIKIPMHDAVLFQHSNNFDPSIVTKIFSDTMTEHFLGKIVGKASCSDFFSI